MRASEVDFNGGMERAAGEVSRHRVRRHPRPVLRPPRALSDRRQCSRYQLSLHGRLCRSVFFEKFSYFFAVSFLD